MLNYIKHLPTGTIACTNRRNADGVELIDWAFTPNQGSSSHGTSEIKLNYFAVGRWVNGFEINDCNGDIIFVRLTDVINRNRIAR
jgi:hypothetical protein